MGNTCFLPDHAANLVASVFAAAIGMFLIIRTLDQWQVQRARRRRQRDTDRHRSR